MSLAPKKTAAGLRFLNVGCGKIFHPEWNNLDLYSGEHVIFHDVRQGLPFRNENFDAVYSSHVLEHLSPPEGVRLVQELFRILKPGGVARLVVPDLERICEEYLHQLRAVASDASLQNRRRYQWIKLELLDQMVREVPGGQMIETLEAGDFDPEYVEYRNGDEFSSFYQPGRNQSEPNPPDCSEPSRGHSSFAEKLIRKGPRGIVGAAWRRIRRTNPPQPVVLPQDDCRSSGELHKWMYDRFSLKILLEECGFVNFRVCGFDESQIPDWTFYQLDQATTGNKPRKPDSLFVEANKPESVSLSSVVSTKLAGRQVGS